MLLTIRLKRLSAATCLPCSRNPIALYKRALRSAGALPSGSRSTWGVVSANGMIFFVAGSDRFAFLSLDFSLVLAVWIFEAF